MIERFRRCGWPAVIILFGFCVLLKLNGSSVAFWTKILHEPETQSGLLLFSPKLVRLDERHAWTPSVLSQARQNSPFPIENHPNPHVLLLKIERDIQRLIRRPIIHENDLEIGGDLLEFSAQPPVKLIDVRGRLVQCGDD